MEDRLPLPAGPVRVVREAVRPARGVVGSRAPLPAGSGAPRLAGVLSDYMLWTRRSRGCARSRTSTASPFWTRSEAPDLSRQLLLRTKELLSAKQGLSLSRWALRARGGKAPLRWRPSLGALRPSGHGGGWSSPSLGGRRCGSCWDPSHAPPAPARVRRSWVVAAAGAPVLGPPIIYWPDEGWQLGRVRRRSQNSMWPRCHRGLLG